MLRKQRLYEGEAEQWKTKASENEKTMEDMLKKEQASQDEVARLKAQVVRYKKEAVQIQTLYKGSVEGDSKTGRRKKAKQAVKDLEAQMGTKIKQED